MYPKEEKTLKAQSSNIDPSTRKTLHKFGAQKIVVVRENNEFQELQKRRTWKT
jgi:hypothetical protein